MFRYFPSEDKYIFLLHQNSGPGLFMIDYQLALTSNAPIRPNSNFIFHSICRSSNSDTVAIIGKSDSSSGFIQLVKSASLESLDTASMGSNTEFLACKANPASNNNFYITVINIFKFIIIKTSYLN